MRESALPVAFPGNKAPSADSEACRSPWSERVGALENLLQRRLLPSSPRSPETRRKRVSQKRLSMGKIRELLRLKYELGGSHREIATSLDDGGADDALLMDQ